MGWSTTIIPPPDGDVSDYLKSLQLLMDAAMKSCTRLMVGRSPTRNATCLRCSTTAFAGKPKSSAS